MANHKNTPEAFYARVDKGGPNGCWSWLGSTNKLGYGQLGYQNRRVTAHRLSYELNKGEIPAGQIVRHACDNPNCCNPDHLILGTHQDNADDRKARGRKRGPSGAPSINPTYKPQWQRDLERYGACEAGHTLTPDNLYTKLNGEVVCLTCYYTNRQKVEQEPIIAAEIGAHDTAVSAIRAALEAVPIGYRPRTMAAIFSTVRSLLNEELHKKQ